MDAHGYDGWARNAVKKNPCRSVASVAIPCSISSVVELHSFRQQPQTIRHDDQCAPLVSDNAKGQRNGAEGLVEVSIMFPVWFDPMADNGTPMCQALWLAHTILESSAKSRNFTNPMPGVEAAGGPGIAMAAPESP